MKKIFVLLLACVLVFSIMVSISACKPKDPSDDTPGDTPGTGDTPNNQIDGNVPDESNNGINLPIIPVNPNTPEVGEGTTEGENNEG